VNEKSLARRSEMEVSQRLPGTLVIDSKFALVQERAPQCATIKAAEERAVPTGRADTSLIALEQEPVIPPDETAFGLFDGSRSCHK